MTRQPTAERVPVLMYHRIGDSENDWERKYCVTPAHFASHMRALFARGYRACEIDRMVDWLSGRGELPAKSFLLTFDDGFMGVYDYAAPLLRDLGWPATVFLVSDLIGQCDRWTARQNPSGRTYPLLGKAEIEAMARQGLVSILTPDFIRTSQACPMTRLPPNCLVLVACWKTSWRSRCRISRTPTGDMTNV